jgi:hypothetical protein
MKKCETDTVSTLNYEPLERRMLSFGNSKVSRREP